MVQNLEEYTGKMVILTVKQDDGSAKQLEGKVEAASDQGIAFKEKGKREVDLVLPDKIDEIAVAPEKPKTLAQKKLQPIADSAVRQHLLDRHGMSRTKVNKMSEAEAVELHNSIDHSDLGHRHEAKDEAEASEESDAA